MTAELQPDYVQARRLHHKRKKLWCGRLGRTEMDAISRASLRDMAGSTG